MKSVIFDLDGTLADTSADLIAAANIILYRAGCGEPLDAKDDKLLAYKGGRALLEAGFKKVGKRFDDQWFIREGYQSFLKVYEANLSVHTCLFPEVARTLDELMTHGWQLGICTNKPERLARILLADLDVMDRFQSLIGADTLPNRKPHPEPLLQAISEIGSHPNRSLLVGDTDTDVNTARAANVPVIAVALDAEQEKVSRTLGADALLFNYAELRGISERLCSSV